MSKVDGSVACGDKKFALRFRRLTLVALTALDR